MPRAVVQMPVLRSRRMRRTRSVLWRNKFFSTTSLPGFGLIQASGSKCEAFFWYVLLICFAALTIRNAISLTSQYTTKATVTRVFMGKLGRYHNLGVFQLRVQMVLPELNPEFGAGNFPFNYPQPYNGSLETELTSALKRLNSKHAFLTKRWDYVLLPVVTRYVSFMSNCEYLNEICNSQDLMEMPFKLFMFEAFTEPGLAPVKAAVDVVLEHTRRLNVSQQEMVHKYGRELLDFVGFKLTDPEIEWFRPNDLWKVWRLQLMSVLQGRELGSIIAFFEVNRTEPIGVGLDYGFRVDANLSSLEKLLVGSQVLGSNSTIATAREWYMQFKPEIMFYYGNDATIPLRANIGELKFWTIKVSSSFHSIQNCYHNYSKLQCAHDCTWERINNLCKCAPIFIQTTDPRLLGRSHAGCTFADYEDCFENYMEGNIRLNCTETCTADCDIDFYEIPSPEMALAAANEMGISFFILNNQHPVFQETFAQTWHSFMAEMGGTFDFWLGANVITILHLVVFFIKQLFYLIIERCKRKEKEPPRSETELVMKNCTAPAPQFTNQWPTVPSEDDEPDRIHRLEARIAQLEAEMNEWRKDDMTL